MSPSNWIGLGGLCAVIGLVITVVSRSVGAGTYFGRMTEAVERIDGTLAGILIDLRGQAALIRDQDRRLFELEQERREGNVVRFRQTRRGGGHEA